MAFGTLSVLDTLRASDQTIIDFGEDRAEEAIQAAFAAHNEQFNEMASQLAETTTDRQRRYGTLDSMEMQELDEYGAPDAQKVTFGDTVGFPMRLYGGALQWTRSYFLRHEARELAAQVTAMMDADIRNMQSILKDAVFTPTNASFTDRLVDNVELSVKRLVNGDGAQIPVGPNGETFDGDTHSHYLGVSGGTLANADVLALVEHVAEHYNTGQTVLYINRAQESAIREMDAFTAYVDARIVPGSGTTVAQGNLDTTNLYNRAIGIFDIAEVWVKPWIPPNYMLAWQSGVPQPLVRRVDPVAGGDLVLIAEDERHPLRARQWERRHGIGAWNRTAAAVLDTQNETYNAP